MAVGRKGPKLLLGVRLNFHRVKDEQQQPATRWLPRFSQWSAALHVLNEPNANGIHGNLTEASILEIPRESGTTGISDNR